MTSICFVGLDSYPVLNPACGSAYVGGESVQQTLLAREFARQGFSVSMVVTDCGQPAGEIIDGIRVLPCYRPQAGMPGLRFLYPRASGLLAAMARADADIYYQSCAGLPTGLAAWHCRRRGRFFVFRVAHDTDCLPGRQLIRFWRDRRLYEYGLRRSHLVAAQSLTQASWLRQHYGLDSPVVDMVVEIPPEVPRERDIDVLWVNNLRPFKRPELAVELARRLAPARVTMIGGPCLGAEALYQEIAQTAAQVANLDFRGFIPYHQVNAFYGRAKVLVNTSDSEGFPNSFLQAWARGTPVVSFFDPDGLLGRLGLGRRPPDLDGMVAAVSGLLAGGEARAAMGERGRAFVEQHHAPAAVVRRYCRLLAERGARLPGRC
ncbi:MAG: glycosyltransferase family 4 protein [Thermodesulfobacteriota bacterium]